MEGVMGYYAGNIYCTSGVLPLCSYGASFGSYLNLSCVPSDYWDVEMNNNQLDATYYIIVLLIGSKYFGHYYAHNQ